MKYTEELSRAKYDKYLPNKYCFKIIERQQKMALIVHIRAGIYPSTFPHILIKMVISNNDHDPAAVFHAQVRQ